LLRKLTLFIPFTPSPLDPRSFLSFSFPHIDLSITGFATRDTAPTLLVDSFRRATLANMDGMDYDPMVMDGEPEQPQVKISAV
jgi:hypothetical protein